MQTWPRFASELKPTITLQKSEVILRSSETSTKFNTKHPVEPGLKSQTKPRNPREISVAATGCLRVRTWSRTRHEFDRPPGGDWSFCVKPVGGDSTGRKSWLHMITMVAVVLIWENLNTTGVMKCQKDAKRTFLRSAAPRSVSG